MKVAVSAKDFHEHIVLAEGADRMFLISSLLALLALLFVGWYCYINMARLRNLPLILSASGITPSRTVAICGQRS